MNRLSALILAMALAACASAPPPAPAPAQPAAAASAMPPLIPLGHFFDNPEIAGAQISPDGQWLSYLKPYREKLNIHVRPIGGGAERVMTTDTVRPISGYFWAVDSRQILYVQDSGGDENFHVHAVPLAGTGTPEARNLTPFPGARAQIFAVRRELPDRILIGLNRRDPSVFDAYWLDLGSGELTMAAENPGRLSGFYLDPQHRITVATGQGPGGENIIFRRDDEAAAWRELASYPADESVNVLRHHPDGRRIYITTNHGATDLARLALLDLATGAETVIESDPQNQVDIGGASFSDVTNELLATVYVGDTVRIYPKTEQMARDLARLREVHAGSPSVSSETLDERRWVVTFSSPTDPGATYLYDRDSGEATFLFRPRPWLNSEHLSEMQPISYRARDGLTVHGYLSTPRGVEPRNLPLVLLVHGGPWARDFWGYQPEAQLLANRGYAVLQLNYRGSTGYGKAFYNAAVREFAGAMHTDLIDGVEWAVAQGIADRERVGIYGGSYGGYATLVGLTFTPDVFACGVSYVGPSSLITLIESFPQYWRPFLEGTWFRFVGDPADPETRADLERRSPITRVDSIRAPLLIVQGQNDPRVTKLESDQLAIALRDRGVPVRYINAENEGHGFVNPDNRLAFYRSMELFFGDCLGGRTQPEVDPAIERRIAEMRVDVDTLRLPTPAAAAPAVSFRGAALQPGTFRYRQVVETQGRTIEGESTHIVAEGTHEGAPVWLLIEQSQAGGMTGADTVVVARETLHPIRRLVHQGPAHITLDFADGSVRGQIDAGPQQMPIQATVQGRVYVDGTALNHSLRTLPLQSGTAATLDVFDLLASRSVQRRVEVSGAEQVTVPAGTFDAVRIVVSPTDGTAGGTTLWVERAAPHRLLRAVSTIPAMAGGGTATMELVGN
jgi:dipeptidyl aminopeptidase/acylaminoacyl peptidase